MGLETEPSTKQRSNTKIETGDKYNLFMCSFICLFIYLFIFIYLSIWYIHITCHMYIYIVHLSSYMRIFIYVYSHMYIYIYVYMSKKINTSNYVKCLVKNITWSCTFDLHNCLIRTQKKNDYRVKFIRNRMNVWGMATIMIVMMIIYYNNHHDDIWW